LFRLKICGITNIEDARAAAVASADAIGLNFFANSPRYISRDQAMRIVESLPPAITPVGVFVNECPSVIRRLTDELRLGTVQLHGDESAEEIAELAGIPILKAFRASDDVRARVLSLAEACRQRSAPLAAVLLDAAKPGLFGGTGALADWNIARQLRESIGDIPLILAGGLTPENVADAIHAVQPLGVDTASGVETSPGKKDPERVRAFIRAAKQALGL
jgi:phosphoribosylanthranilate isomerase